MNKKIILSSALLAVLFGATAVYSAQAYRGDPNVQCPSCSAERHDAMKQAFNNNDYRAWKELMGDRGATRVVNADNFARFAEAHRLAEQGKINEARQIRQELGLGNGLGKGNGCCGGMMKGGGCLKNRSSVPVQEN